eukprot:COSAG01_NODE_7967_length_2971_cov_31.735724_1_plen_116_part_10
MEAAEGLLQMVMEVTACTELTALRALAMGGHDPQLAIELVLLGHPALGQGAADTAEAGEHTNVGQSSSSLAHKQGQGDPNSGSDGDVAEMVNWGLSEGAAKLALIQNGFDKQRAVE